MNSIEVDILADQIHAEMCNDMPGCFRWRNPDSPHRKYYQDRAESIIEQLEPEIGITNVYAAVRVILDEVLS